MSTIKYKTDEKWETLYEDDINYYGRQDENLADMEDKTETRKNLGIVGDVETHHHDTRYETMVRKEAAERTSKDEANRNKLNEIKNNINGILTTSSRDQIVNSLATLSSNTDTEINTRKQSDKTLKQTIKTGLEATQKVIDDNNVKELNTTGTSFDTGNGAALDVKSNSYNSGSGSGVKTITETRTFSMKNLPAGKYKLEQLLVKLAKLSHYHTKSHSVETKQCYNGCDCNYCGGSGGCR